MTCADCGASIADRHFNAYLCKPCGASRKTKAIRRWMDTHTTRASRSQGIIGSSRSCESCGKPYLVTIGNRRFCRSCARENEQYRDLIYKRQRHPVVVLRCVIAGCRTTFNRVSGHPRKYCIPHGQQRAREMRRIRKAA